MTGRRALVAKHPQRAAIEAALIQGVPLTAVSDRYGISVSSLFRWRQANLRPQLAEAVATQEAEHAARATDLLGRVLDVADSARATRHALQASGHVAGAVRAGEAELRALDTLMRATGLDDLAVLDQVRASEQVVAALITLAKRNPEAGLQVADILRDRGADALANDLDGAIQRHQAIRKAHA